MVWNRTVESQIDMMIYSSASRDRFSQFTFDTLASSGKANFGKSKFKKVKTIVSKCCPYFKSGAPLLRSQICAPLKRSVVELEYKCKNRPFDKTYDLVSACRWGHRAFKIGKSKAHAEMEPQKATGDKTAR